MLLYTLAIITPMVSMSSNSSSSLRVSFLSFGSFLNLFVHQLNHLLPVGDMALVC